MKQSPSIAEVMGAYALDAVNFAQAKLQKKLDFSEDSIKVVEKILGQYHTEKFKASPAPEAINLVCNIFGAYIGEVIRRKVGGEWVINDRMSPGKNIVSLQVKHLQTSPPAKVYKRIVDGSGDDVWFYYRVFVEQMKEGGIKRT